MAYPLKREEIEHYMNEGHEAFMNKFDMKNMPYSKFSAQGRLWLRGYNNARYGSNLVAVRG